MATQWLFITALTIFAGTLPVAAATPTPLPGDSPDGSPVTLHVTAASLDSVIAELTKQTGNPVKVADNGGFNGAAPKTITLNVDSRPFWEVLGNVCQQAGMSVRIEPDDSVGLYPVNQWGDSGGQVYISGPIFFRAGMVIHNHVLTRPGQAGEYCAVQIYCMWEPRMAVLFSRKYAAPDAAVDENGLSLVPTADTPMVDGREYFDPSSIEQYQFRDRNGGNNTGVEFLAPIAVSDKVGRHIPRISGKFPVWVASKFEDVDVPDVNAPRTNMMSSLRVLNNGMDVAVSRNGGNGAQVMLSRNGATADQWLTLRRNFQSIRATAINDAGKTIQGYNGGSGSNGDTQYLYFYFQENNVSQMKVKFPDDVKEIDVPYQFENLPLP